jgi:hypothetical protein
LISTEYWHKYNQRLELVKGCIYFGKLETLGNGGDKIISIKWKGKQTMTEMKNI